jgi:predicted nucleic acid-binding protein
VNAVIDASAAVEYLFKTDTGLRVAEVLRGARLLAPELMDAEVLSVLRRATLSKRLKERRAQEAIEDLRDWPVERVRHRDLLAEAWSLRTRVTAYDAFYVALAQLRRATLVTADGPLARASALRIAVHNVRV